MEAEAAQKENLEPCIVIVNQMEIDKVKNQ